MHIVLAICALLLSASSVHAQRLTFSEAAACSVEDESVSWTLSSGLALDLDRARLAVSLPIVYENSVWQTLSGTTRMSSGSTGRSGMRSSESGGGMMSGSTAANSQWNFGLGDPTVLGSWEVLRSVDLRTSVDLYGSVKPPLMDPEQGIGTGSWDGGVGASYSHVGSDVGWFADGSLWMLGDLAGDTVGGNSIDAVVLTGGAMSRLGTQRSSFFGSLSATIPTASVDPLRLDANFGAAYRLENQQRVGAFLSVGLNDPSPRVSAGLTWAVDIMP